ncbi:hypothetical protein SAMN04488515_2734 [Cognatiyoonia koreensis]|uniref:Uncharacterized protein n=1 Tax=Cognatiyoonia koreensis TaxID=364200 RepID=A0A1I0RID1_9RHOB|nr:hypothetical protein [Cognatiyoonia koreensis]SEW40701.1 hypothetical protein SAMN04488515_2734 [Cognatiyoonia koreensis]
MCAAIVAANAGLRKLGVFASCLVACLATAPLADGFDLAERIAAAERAVSPDLRFDVHLDGCTLHWRQSQPNERNGARDISWYLADFETDPARLMIDSQTTADSGETWVTSQVFFPLRTEIAQRFSADIARYQDALAAVEDHGTGFFDWLWRDPTADIEAAEMLADLVDQRRTGAFGPLLQRNVGIAEGETPLTGRYYEPYGLIDVDFVLTLRGDLRDAILQDLHAYRLQNCPAPE